jgi:hypothetical protein
MTKKSKTAAIVPVVASFDISQLPSGNYNLVIQMISKENKILAKQKVFFQRSNPAADKKWDEIAKVDLNGSFIEPYKNMDSLKEFVRCLFPISNQIEWDKALTVLEKSDSKELKQYIVTFWQNRNSLDPEMEWKKYME